jgi:pimeloyl-ACP methyl ester carboxylesterase
MTSAQSSPRLETHAGLVVERHGSGYPVVFVHPSAGGLRSFDPIIPLLQGFESWVYARRGYAPSEPAPTPKTLADDAADLTAIVEAAGGRAHVVGASYGAVVALHAARSEAVRIEPPLVLFEPPLFAAGAPSKAAVARFARHLDMGELREAGRLFAAEVARLPSSLLDALPDEEPDPDELAGCRSDLEALAADSPDVERWAEVTMPVLLMQGTETWEPMPQTMDALGAALPSVTRCKLAGQSHFATHTAPELFAARIEEALRRPRSS